MLKIVQIVLNKFSGENRNIMLLFNRRKTVSWLLQTIFTDVTFHIFFSLFRVILLSMSLRFYMGLHSSGIPQGEGTEELFCLIEHFFYIRQHKEHFLQSLSRTEENPLPPPWGKISSDAKHGLRGSSRFRPLHCWKNASSLFIKKDVFTDVAVVISYSW